MSFGIIKMIINHIIDTPNSGEYENTFSGISTISQTGYANPEREGPQPIILAI